MKLAFVFMSSDSYMPRTKVAMESFDKFHPDIDQHLLMLPDSTATYIEGGAKGRIEKAKELLEGEYDGVIVIGSDCVLYAKLFSLLWDMSDFSIVLTPHVITPPKNAASFYQTGHVNADLIGFTKQAIPILDWLISQPMVNDVRSGSFYEQTLLSSVPFIYPDHKILHEANYNYAYFNFNERDLVIKEDKYYVEDHGFLVMAQFSGWEEGQLPKASKHSSIQITNPTTLKLFQEYEENVKRFK